MIKQFINYTKDILFLPLFKFYCYLMLFKLFLTSNKLSNNFFLINKKIKQPDDLYNYFIYIKDQIGDSYYNNSYFNLPENKLFTKCFNEE